MARIQDESLFRQVCETFVRDAPDRVASIRGALDRGRPADAAVSAHALKAAAANVGAEQCRMVAAELERQARRGDGAEVRAVLPLFEDAWHQFREALAAVGWGGGNPEVP